jgi:hypothetical protein
MRLPGFENKAGNPDGYRSYAPGLNNDIFKGFFQIGFEVPIVGMPAVAVDEQFKDWAIQAMRLFCALFIQVPARSPGDAEMGNALEESISKDEFDMLVGNGFGGTLAIVQALKDSGRYLTRAKFVAALEKLNNFQDAIIPGYEYPMCSPVSFSTTDHVALKSVTFSVLGKDKKLKIVQNYKEYTENINSGTSAWQKRIKELPCPRRREAVKN